MVLYAVVEWNAVWTVVELDLTSEIPTGHPVADCPSPENAHRIATLLSERARDTLTVEP